MANIPSKPEITKIQWINGQTKLNQTNLTSGVNNNLDSLKAAVDGIIDALGGAGTEPASDKTLDQASIAAYDPSVTYSKGTLVLHDGKYYRAQQNGVTGTWDASKWSLLAMSTPVDSDLDPDSTNPVQNAIVTAHMLGVEAAVEQLALDFAPAYSASAAYAVGDLVSKDNKVYACKSAIAAPGEAWNAAHWDEVNMKSLLDGKLSKGDYDGSTGVGFADRADLADLADNLTTDLSTAETFNYLQKSEIGSAIDDETYADASALRGHSTCMVQLGRPLNATNWSYESGLRSFSNGVTVLTLNSNAGLVIQRCRLYADSSHTNTIYRGHKYMLLIKAWTDGVTIPSTAYGSFRCAMANVDSYFYGYLNNPLGQGNDFTSTEKLFACFATFKTTYSSSSNTGRFIFGTTEEIPSTYDGVKIYYKDVMVFDLTAIFGAGSEPTTYATAKAKFAERGIDIENYVDYTEGKIIDCLPTALVSYDSEDNEIGRKAIDAPVMRGVDCPSVSGIPDGVVDDAAKIRVGTYTVGSSLTWTSAGVSPGGMYKYYSNGIISDMMPQSTSVPGICSKYPIIRSDNPNSFYKPYPCVLLGFSNANIYFFSPEELTTSQVKSLMNGVTFNYRLNTPITRDTPIALPDRLPVQNGGSIAIEYDSANNCGADITMAFKPNIKNYVEGVGSREDVNWDKNALVSQSELGEAVSASDEKVRDDLKNGTLIPALSKNMAPYDDESGMFNEEPFVFEATATDNGTNLDAIAGSYMELREKRGNTIGANQQVNPSSYSALRCSRSISGGKITCTFKGTNGLSYGLYRESSTVFKASHVYLIHYSMTSTVTTSGAMTLRFNNGYQDFGQLNLTPNTKKTTTYLYTAPYTNEHYIYFSVIGKNAGDKLILEDLTIIDLTQWFGSNDKIPSDITAAHPGNFFRYYRGSMAYKAPSLLSSNAKYIEPIGRNQYDGTNDVIAIPNTEYYIYGSATLTYKDAYGSTISTESKSNETFTTPYGCLLIGVEGSGDITISLYYEGEAGYDQHYSYESLAKIDTGDEVLNSAGSICDIKTSDGVITRNVGIETLDAAKAIGDTIAISSIKSDTANVVSKLGLLSEWGTISGTTITLTKALASGDKIYYELTSSASEEGTPYQEVIPCDDFGSVSVNRIGDETAFNGVPMANKIFYPADYKAYLDSVYKDTNGDPDLVTQGELAGTNEQIREDLENGNLIPALSDNITPYDESSGDDQDEPFLFQATGTANGTQPDFATGSYCQLKEKRGNSLVWNQKLEITNFAVSGGSITYKGDIGTFVATSYGQQAYRYFYNAISQRKYLVLIRVKMTTASTSIMLRAFGSDYQLQQTTAWQVKSRIITSGTTGNVSVGIKDDRSSDFDAILIDRKAQIIDLTHMFGVGNEPTSTSDPRVKWAIAYAQLHPAYKAGAIINCDGRYLKNIGMNQWDEQWEVGYIDGNTGEPTTDNNCIRSKNFCRCLPNTDYYLKYTASTFIYLYDSNYNFIGRPTVTNNIFGTPSNACYFKIAVYHQGNTYNNDISINLYYEDEARCLTYEPYGVVADVDTGSEVLRSAGSVKDYKEPNGTIHRLVGSYTFSGSESWTFSENSQMWYMDYPSNFNGFVVLTTNYICSNGVRISLANANFRVYLSSNPNITSSTNMNNIFPSGTIIYYELAIPTTEQGTPFQENIDIDDFGTMQWLKDGESDTIIPAEVLQGNLIFYPVDYKAFDDTMYKYTDGTPSNLALKTDLSASETARDAVDARLKEALGGTLRQCLCVKESLDFNNTGVVDLGTLSGWSTGSIGSGRTYVYVDFIEKPANNSTIAKILCSNLQNDTYEHVNDISSAVDLTIAVGVYSDGIIQLKFTDRINSSTDTSEKIQQALKGVLLAYKKASS